MCKITSKSKEEREGRRMAERGKKGKVKIKIVNRKTKLKLASVRKVKP